MNYKSKFTGKQIDDGIDKANSAYQKPQNGIPPKDLSEGVQNSLDKIDALPDHIVTDANYVHTDNNYTTEEKTKLANAITEEQDPTVPSWAKQSSKPTYTAQEVGALPDDTPLFSGDYNDLGNKPTIPTALSQLSEDSTHRVVSDAEKTTWNNKSNFSGSYNDLTDKPTIPDVPTNVSAFNNDAGYLTQHQDISGKEDVTTIVAPVNTTNATLSITTLTTEVGKYYRLDVAVETLTVTLPAITDLTTVRTVVIYLTGGTTPSITISTADSKDVYFQDGFEIEANSTYEINCLFNGVAWIVAAAKINVE